MPHVYKWLVNGQEKLSMLYESITMMITIWGGDIVTTNNAPH